jgi:hypothetical protein
MGLPCAWLGMTAATRSAKFFVCFLGRQVSLGMTRAHRYTTEIQTVQDAADAARLHRYRKSFLDPCSKIDEPPTNEPVLLNIGTCLHPCHEFGLLLAGQTRLGAAAMRLVG